MKAAVSRAVRLSECPLGELPPLYTKSILEVQIKYTFLSV